MILYICSFADVQFSVLSVIYKHSKKSFKFTFQDELQF